MISISSLDHALLFPFGSIDVLLFNIFDRSVARATEQGEFHPSPFALIALDAHS